MIFPLEIEDHSAKTWGVKFLWFFFLYFLLCMEKMHVKKKVMEEWNFIQMKNRSILSEEIWWEERNIPFCVEWSLIFFFFQDVVFQIFVVVRNTLRSRFRSDRKLKCFTALNNVLASFHARIMRFFRLRVLFYRNSALINSFWKFSFKKPWRHISVMLLLTFIFSRNAIH